MHAEAQHQQLSAKVIDLHLRVGSLEAQAQQREVQEALLDSLAEHGSQRRCGLCAPAWISHHLGMGLCSRCSHRGSSRGSSNRRRGSWEAFRIRRRWQQPSCSTACWILCKGGLRWRWACLERNALQRSHQAAD